MAETAICPLNIRRTSQISAMFFLYQKRMAKTLLGRRGAWEKGRTLLVWGLGSGIPYGRPFPGPVPGRLRCPDGPCGRPRPARNRFRAGGFQKRGNQRRPQPVPGGKTVPKPTPVARITFNRELTGARNRFWAPGRPDARTPRPAARARPKKAGAGRRVRHPAPTPVNLPALVKPPATGSSSPRPGRSGPGRRRRGWRSPPCPRSPRRACCPWCRRGRRRPRPRRAPSRG